MRARYLAGAGSLIDVGGEHAIGNNPEAAEQFQAPWAGAGQHQGRARIGHGS